MILKIRNFGKDKGSQRSKVIDLRRNPSPTIQALGLGGVFYSQYEIEENENEMPLWMTQQPHGFSPGAKYNLDKRPSPTVLACGMGAEYHLEVTGIINSDNNKPPYNIPSMEEIDSIPWNGCKVVSTFSGAGGSCLGYRMAGFQVVWANEFVPIVKEAYRANAPGTILDGRDIRKIQPKEILKVTGLEVGELDLFDGSPPCQAFSTAGKRHEGWGKEKTYEHGAKQCNERLFEEYIRLLRGLKPRVFVAENVSGLVKGTAKGMFLEILAALKASGYCVKCRVLDAQWLGVPQARRRAIFIGVRNDLDMEPKFPKPLSYRYSVRDALPQISSVKLGAHGFQEERKIDGSMPLPTVMATGLSSYSYQVEASVVIHDTGNFAKNVPIADRPCPTVPASPIDSTHFLVNGEGQGDVKTGRKPDGKTRRKFTIAELKRICAFPDDFQLTGSYAQQWAQLGNSVPPLMMKAIAETVRDKIFNRLKE